MYNLLCAELDHLPADLLPDEGEALDGLLLLPEHKETLLPCHTENSFLSNNVIEQ